MSVSSPRNFRAMTVGILLSVSLAGCGVFGGKDNANTTPTVGERVAVLSRIESGARVDPSIAGEPVVLPAPEVNADFAQPGGTASKASGHLAFTAAPRRVWTASVAGATQRVRLAASPVVGAGRLYVYDTAGTVHAFDAATGRRQWRTSFRSGGDSKTAVFGGGVSFDDGRVYVATGVGEVAALDAATGAQHWRVKPAGALRGAPTIAFGSVYVMTQDNQIFALAVSDGSTLWQDSGSVGQAGVFGVAAPAAAQGTVIAGYSSGELAAYRYENGRNLWSDALARTSISTSVSTLTDIDADPIIDRGRVFALGQGGRMAAYELVSGQRIWELNLGGISTPAVAGDWVFTLTDDSRLLCIARATGKVRWITQLQRYRNEEKRQNPVFWTGPVLADNRLWIANSRGSMWSVSALDGSGGPVAELSAGVSVAPIIANRTLYILDDKGRITAFR